MRKWKCIESKIPTEVTIGKIYETDNDGYGIIFNTGLKGAKQINRYAEIGSKFVEIKEEDKKVREFKVGDRVRIIKKSWNWNSEGKMDKWLGKIMTIRKICYDRAYMEEDIKEFSGGGWQWYFDCLELISDENNHKSIHITTEGTTTHAVLKDGKEVIKRASVGLYHEDEYKFEIGVMEVVKKLLDVVDEKKDIIEAKQIEYKEVDRCAELGEMIKVTTDRGHEVKIGTISKVVKIYDTGYLYVTVDGHNHCLYLDNYVVLEPVDYLQPKQLSDYSTDEVLEELKRRMEK